MSMVKVDIEKVKTLMKEKHIKGIELSKMMGYSDTWFTDVKRRKPPTVREAQLTQMAAILKCNIEDILEKEILTEDISANNLGMSEFEIQVLELLNAIKKKVDSTHEIAMLYFNEKQKADQAEMPKQDELTTAMQILKDMLGSKVGIKYDDYMEEVRSKGVTNDKVADAAIPKAGYKKKIMGDGNNKKLWIYKEINIT